jgi:Cro/C1-type helix-turn-helix DNA-binding protein
VVAGEDIRKDILKTGIRKLERDTGVSHHTIDKILKGEPVRRKTLAKILREVQLQTNSTNNAGSKKKPHANSHGALQVASPRMPCFAEKTTTLPPLQAANPLTDSDFGEETAQACADA